MHFKTKKSRPTANKPHRKFHVKKHITHNKKQKSQFTDKHAKKLIKKAQQQKIKLIK